MTQNWRKNMLRQRTRSVWIFASVLVLPLIVTAQQAKLVPAKPAELRDIESKLDTKLMPDDARSPHLEDTQVFNLVAPNIVKIALAPVTFEISMEHEAGSSTKTDCGIFLIPTNGPTNFIWTTGKVNYEAGLTECGGVQAVGLQPVANSSPSLIVIFTGHNLHEDFSDFYVLSWDKAAKTYQIDEGWMESIAAHVKVFTIKNIKQFMSQAR